MNNLIRSQKRKENSEKIVNIENIDSFLNLEKLLLYLAFYGSVKERKRMEEFFQSLIYSMEENKNLAFDENFEKELFNTESPENILDSLYAAFGLNSEKLDKEYERLKIVLFERKIHFISVLSENYPPLLRKIKGYPFGLFYKGDVNILTKPCVSVVGSRKASYDAVKMCDNLALHLRGKEVSVVSGLAFGVDSFIHNSCLKHHVKTISVLPSCVDYPIPRNNSKIAQRILEAGGLLLSENPPNYHVHGGSYVERNRIISGISDRTLVVEAAIKSGSMTTAKFAIEQDRDLYAMPGSISNPVAAGCNYLISQGARPLLDAKDFYEGNEKENRKEEQLKALPESDILAFIQKRGRVQVDEIIESLKIDQVEVISKITEYEIMGYVKRTLNDIELV